MTRSIDFYNPLIELSTEKYDKFCQRLQSHITISNLDIFKVESTCDIITELCGDIFHEEIERIIILLNDISIGIAALDIPESVSFDKTMNAVCGAAAVIGIFNNIGKSNYDPINSTPFTLHTASHSNGKLLESTEHTPDAKLGFHNDGLLNSENLEIPKNIVLYNLYIAYRRPGKFRWIPSALWDEAENFGKKINSEKIKINIELTPSFNSNKKGSFTRKNFYSIGTPVSSISMNGQRRFFLNGKVSQNNNLLEHVELVNNIRNSLENNPIKISIEQKERRAFYLRNTEGFHARDIFEDPIEGVDMTRVFLRSVDVNSEVYPSNKINIDAKII